MNDSTDKEVKGNSSDVAERTAEDRSAEYSHADPECEHNKGLDSQSSDEPSSDAPISDEASSDPSNSDAPISDEPSSDVASSDEPINAELKLSETTPGEEPDDHIVQGETTSGIFEVGFEDEEIDDSEPILGQAAREAPNPFRFDLRAMFALTLLIGALFALIRYFGTMYGLLMGAGFCCIALVLLIIAAIILYKRHDQPVMMMFDRMAIRLTAGVVILLVAAFFAGGGSLGIQWYQTRAVAKQLNTDLGFVAETGPVLNHYQYENLLIVESIQSGGVFDKAGIKKGDVIITDLNSNEWHAMLEANRGKKVEVVVAVNGENKSLHRCPHESHEILVPAK